MASERVPVASRRVGMACKVVPVASRQVLIGYEPRVKPGFFQVFSLISPCSQWRVVVFSPRAGKFTHTPVPMADDIFSKFFLTLGLVAG